MLSNKNTQEQKLIEAVELSDAEMGKVSGGDDYDDYRRDGRYYDGYRDGYDDGYRRFDRRYDDDYGYY